MTITMDEVIQILKNDIELSKMNVLFCHNNEYGIGALQMAVETLEQTRWVPVSERLPEDKQQILISIAWDNKVYEVRQGDIDSINYFKHFKRITSIAWMPLPDPYRGEEDET